ncbi:MAG: hypothetical protein HY513_02270 [Candidatus Aenigmarchaeota archaeon]|nr:hypothetical protein [Candidatus Aenigmarchaeota archaeon]
MRYAFHIDGYVPIEKGSAVTFIYGLLRRRVSGFVRNADDSSIEIEFADGVRRPMAYRKDKIIDLFLVTA